MRRLITYFSARYRRRNKVTNANDASMTLLRSFGDVSTKNPCIKSRLMMGCHEPAFVLFMRQIYELFSAKRGIGTSIQETMQKNNFS